LGLAGLSKPMWLSLICRKVSLLAGAASGIPTLFAGSHRHSGRFSWNRSLSSSETRRLVWS
jgi:hypothetical protein